MSFEKRELLEPLFKRVMRAGAGLGVAPKLPLKKPQFPKLLLLDFNQWVRLARMHNQRAFDLPAAAALKAIRVARGLGRLILAFTADTVGEAALPTDPARRRRIAEFIVRESDNVGLINAQTVFEAEVLNAVRELVFGAPRSPPPREKLVHRGIHATLSGSDRAPELGIPRFDPIFAAVMQQPEISVEAIVQLMDADFRASTKQAEDALNQRLNSYRPDWAKLSPQERRDNECRNAFAIGDGAAAYLDALHRGGIDPAAFSAWLSRPGSPAILEARVAHLRVMMELLLRRDRNAQQPYRPNDTRDLRFLQLAIPFANIVVVEKAWGHLAQACGLDREFETTVLLRLEELPAALSTQGCW